MPTLMENLDDYIRAGNTALWLQSHEHEEALMELQALCTTNQWVLMTWDPADGLVLQQTKVPVNWPKDITKENVPVSVFPLLESIAQTRIKATNTPTTPSVILVLRNIHSHLESNAVLKQNIIKAATLGRKSRAFVIILSPLLKIPPEMEKLMTLVEHDLPNRDQLQKIAKTLATEEGEYPTDVKEEQAMLEAATGLSRVEAENAYSLSIIRNNRIVPQSVWEEKSRSLLKDGLLQLHRGEATFTQLGGLDQMKQFHLQLLNGKHKNPLARPKATLLLSPPGCGKSQFCKALGHETHRPVVSMDIGTLMGGRVGQSEGQTRSALRSIDSMAPCILFIDEIEKGLSGVGAGGNLDSGVTQRVFGSILKWLNDHTSDVFTIATCNDISQIMATNPELVRAERFDGMFFIDLPAEEERKKIWDIYLKLFGIAEKGNPRPDDTDWTGAEIRTCCRLAVMLNKSLVDAAKLVVPIKHTAGPQIDVLRNWASGRCLSATFDGLYTVDEQEQAKPAETGGRVISRVKTTKIGS